MIIIGNIIIMTFDGEVQKVVDLLRTQLGFEMRTIEMINKDDVSLLRYRDLVLDEKRKEAICRGNKIDLTFMEFDILYFLAKNPGRVFNKEQIYEYATRSIYDGDSSIIMVHISRIRKKLEENPSCPQYIKTVRGKGYWFDGEHP